MQAFSSLPRAANNKRRTFTAEAHPSTALRTRSTPRRPQKPGVECWGEVEGVLAELGRLAKHWEEVRQRQTERLARVEAEGAEERRELEQRQRELEESLERFCRKQGPALDRVDGHGRRSRRLLFGRVGYRGSQAVVIRDEAAALEALAGWRAGRQFLRVRTELDRESLRQFLLEAAGRNGNGARVRRRLGRAGIRVEQREKWFYEIDWEAVERWSTQHSAPAYAPPRRAMAGRRSTRARKSR